MDLRMHSLFIPSLRYDSIHKPVFDCSLALKRSGRSAFFGISYISVHSSIQHQSRMLVSALKVGAFLSLTVLSIVLCE